MENASNILVGKPELVHRILISKNLCYRNMVIQFVLN